MKTKLRFYDFGPVLSYNAVYNFITGMRGVGKTYGAKKRVIKSYLEKGEEFIYLRRYKGELSAKDTFFSDISDEFPEWIFRVNGDEAQLAPNDGADKPIWETFGYFVALSVSQQLKSRAYPLVTTIIFDEFIIEKGNVQYLRNEVKVFNDFYSTVDRWKDKTKVLFLANAISIMNPYFMEYDIMPQEGKEFIKAAGGFIVAHFPQSYEFASAVSKTRFGSFVIENDPDYAAYSIGNVFHDNSGNLVDSKPKEARYWFTLVTRANILSLWTHNGLLYVQAKRPRKERMITIEHTYVREDMQLITFGDKLSSNLRHYYRLGLCRFDSPQSRNAFVEIFRRR